MVAGRFDLDLNLADEVAEQDFVVDVENTAVDVRGRGCDLNLTDVVAEQEDAVDIEDAAVDTVTIWKQLFLVDVID